MRAEIGTLQRTCSVPACRLSRLLDTCPHTCCPCFHHNVQGIWVSRPASYNPLISFLNEAIMTFMFLFLVSLMTARCAVGIVLT